MTDRLATESPPELDQPRSVVESYARDLAAIGCAAAVSGILVAGVGGRLAMRILAAANPEDSGAITDDGFVVGDVTVGGTAQLLGAALQVTLIGAAVFVLIRPLLPGPAWLRTLILATGVGTVVGALMVQQESVDFAVLDPPLLPIGIFVGLPFAVVLVFGLLAERWLADDSWFASAPFPRIAATAAVWLLATLALVVIISLLLIGLGIRKTAGALRGSAVARLGVIWAGRTLLAVAFGAALLYLAGDVNALV